MTNQWAVAIPDWHPIRTNQLVGADWRTVYKLKKEQHFLIALSFWKASVPPADRTVNNRPAKVKRRVTLKIVLGPRQRGGDPDSYWKVLLDSLVKCHVLVDDRKEWVELAPVQYERGKKSETIIMIEDLEPVEMKRSVKCIKR